MINLDPPNDAAILDSLNIYKGAPSIARSTISKLDKVYWDCFAEEGINCPILRFEFAIDTGKHTPIC